MVIVEWAPNPVLIIQALYNAPPGACTKEEEALHVLGRDCPGRLPEVKRTAFLAFSA